MKRKPIQILTLTTSFLGITTRGALMVLCDDGTIWGLSSEREAKWEQQDFDPSHDEQTQTGEK